MSRRRAWPIAIVVGAVVLSTLLVVGLVGSFERVERVVRTPPSSEVRQNPLLAAERFLRRMGLTAGSSARLDALPPHDHMMILAAERRVLTRVRSERLLEWVYRGGHLVIGPYLEDGRPTPQSHDDPLLEALDVGLEEYDPDPQREPRETVEMETFAEPDTHSVEFYSDFALIDLAEEDREAAEDSDSEPYAMIWRPHGDGQVFVLQDLRFLHFHDIGKLDHAAFLWGLVSAHGERDVLLVHGTGDASIWSLLARRAWPVLPAATLLVAGWLWRHALRFGPPIPTAPHGSRALFEHIDALGWFLWRTGRADALVAGARRALEQRVVLRRPDFPSLSRRRQVALLAAASGLDEATVGAAVAGGAPRRREAFTRTIGTFERLRRAL